MISKAGLKGAWYREMIKQAYSKIIKGRAEHRMLDRTVLFSCLLAFSLTAGGCDKIYRLLQKEGAEEMDLIGEIRPFESNDKVAKVQYRLKLFGYGVGAVDGALGANTRNSIEQFQIDYGLNPSRFIDYETWNQLMMFDDYGLILNDEINPIMVQTALKNAGYEVGKVDGKLGPRSVEMLKKFQKNEGLESDGKIGVKTLTALARYLPVPESPGLTER